jgi:hypothetical protein
MLTSFYAEDVIRRVPGFTRLPPDSTNIKVTMNMEQWRKNTNTVQPKYWQTTLSNSHLSTTNLTLTDMGYKSGLRGERPTTD